MSAPASTNNFTILVLSFITACINGVNLFWSGSSTLGFLLNKYSTTAI